MNSAGYSSYCRLMEEGTLAISSEHLSAAAKEARASGRSLKQTLVDLGLAKEAPLLQGLAKVLGLPYADLASQEVDPAALAFVPAKVVEHYGVMPLKITNGQLRVAIDDPFNYDAVHELGLVLGKQVVSSLAPREDILKAIRKHYGLGAETIERLVDQDNDAVVESAHAADQDLALESQAQQASVVKLVNQILLDALRERATDVHMEPFEDELRVRYRVDGLLREAGVPAAARHFRSAIVSRIKIMANLDIAEKRLPQDGRAQVKLGDEQFDLRISVLPVAEGEGVNIRILPRTPIFSDLASLGLDAPDLVKLGSLLDQPHGIILATGPTGSGKTTTLYACLMRINKPHVKILTIEDPIEYRIRGIQQMQVAPEIGFTFSRALRSMLRHDPDVMLVGEIRDAETADIAIRTALTGHLVLSTLHTNDASGSATRLIDMGVEPYLISSSVLGMVAQRLVRTICPHCKAPAAVDPKLVRGFAPEIDPGSVQLFRGTGCERCRLSGYRGRTAIYEIIVMSDRIRELVQARSPAQEIKRAARQEGMRTLRQAGWEKVLAGLTTMDEVIRVSQDEKAMIDDA
jgi:type II secretory ATPase GspE/PulE/Tfp pilus assembly ATPase PilB-like protein